MKLSFIYAYPLDRGRRNLFTEKGIEYPSISEIQESLKHWQEMWSKMDEKKQLISLISKMTGRVPERNLECFVFGTGLNAMSTPFLLPIWDKNGKKWSDEKIYDLIIHELLHIFLTSNNDTYWKHVNEKYKEEDPACRNHILLYAMLYEIYEKIFNKEPIDFNRKDLPEGYARAVKIVKNESSKKLIREYVNIIS